jgi:hypothetical protein
MVEADSHLKQLPTSILDIYKVFEHRFSVSAVQKNDFAALTFSLASETLVWIVLTLIAIIYTF